jgi:hypothetical protein
MLALLPESAEIVWQVTSYREIFDVGSLLLIHGKITILPSNRGIAGRQHGSFKATYSRNGKYPEQVPSYGSTGNVRCHPAFNPSQRLMVFPLRSGLWEECTLVR